MREESREVQAIRPSGVERRVREWYVRWIVPRVADPIKRQRLKLVWYAWGYWRLLFLRAFSLRDRVRILWRFLRIDWNVLHAHLPSEMSILCRALSERRARPGEVVLEAGGWQGGSSTKFSIVCKMLGYRLCVCDSFEGVEVLPPEDQAKEWDLAGQYASPECVLRANLVRYGEASVCSIHKGWFSETLAKSPVPYRVRVAYIDCDLAKGTKEALNGIVPSLVEDGLIFSQDFHIEPVRRLLCESATWERFGKGTPNITPLGQYLASIRFSTTKG